MEIIGVVKEMVRVIYINIVTSSRDKNDNITVIMISNGINKLELGLFNTQIAVISCLNIVWD